MSKITGIGWLAAALLVAAPVYAHEVEISSDVGATLHIEPDDKPKAGEPAQIWFALTAKGGRVIPLSECSCKLKVYAEPHKEGTNPLLEPTLKGISAEQYKGIPSAEVTFPKIGEYELELSGSPKAGAKFTPFELSYKVVVATQSESSKELVKPQKSQSTELAKPADPNAKPDSTTAAVENTEARRNASGTESPAANLWWIIPGGIIVVGIVGGAILLMKWDSD